MKKTTIYSSSQSQPSKSCKQNEVNRTVNPQLFIICSRINNEYQIMTTRNSASMLQHANCFTLIYWRLVMSRRSSRCIVDRKNLITQSNSLDNYSFLLSTQVVSFCTFFYTIAFGNCKIFIFGGLNYASAAVGFFYLTYHLNF